MISLCRLCNSSVMSGMNFLFPFRDCAIMNPKSEQEGKKFGKNKCLDNV